ncbi:MAG: lipid-A-disaccharide synthase [Bacteroidetes bacterium]|nr:MAG: lipid-A-disaccharide synthase [Bacteroidota bacterium]
MVAFLPGNTDGNYGVCATNNLVSNASWHFMNKTSRIFMVAGEASGDIYGGLLAREFSDQTTSLRGWGGENMSDSGVHITKHYRELAYMGLWEVLVNLRTILRNLDLCWSEIEEFKPDAIVLIDFPGFNMRIARKAKNAGIKVYQVVAPQVWAWKKGRIKDLARDYTAVFPVLPFEHDILKSGGVNSIYCGHPLLDAIAADKDPGETPGETLDLENTSKPILALLPGSRSQELKKMLPILCEVAAKFPDMHPIIAGAPGASKALYLDAEKLGISVIFGSTRNLLRSASLAVVTSGTATLEAALLKTPHVIVYKTSWLTYLAARTLLHIDQIGLPNILLKRSAVPELIQSSCTPENIASVLSELDVPSQKSSFLELSTLLGSTTTIKEIASHIKVST